MSDVVLFDKFAEKYSAFHAAGESIAAWRGGASPEANQQLAALHLRQACNLDEPQARYESLRALARVFNADGRTATDQRVRDLILLVQQLQSEVESKPCIAALVALDGGLSVNHSETLATVEHIDPLIAMAENHTSGEVRQAALEVLDTMLRLDRKGLMLEKERSRRIRAISENEQQVCPRATVKALLARMYRRGLRL